MQRDDTTPPRFLHHTGLDESERGFVKTSGRDRHGCGVFIALDRTEYKRHRGFVGKGVESLLGRIEIPADLRVAPGELLPRVQVQHEDGDIVDVTRIADEGPALLMFFRGFW